MIDAIIAVCRREATNTIPPLPSGYMHNLLPHCRDLPGCQARQSSAPRLHRERARAIITGRSLLLMATSSITSRSGAISIEALRGCHAAATSGWNDCFGCMQGDTLVHGAYKGRAGVRTDAEAGL